MAKQVINLGTTPNDGTGTDIRTGGDMINDNFTELYGFTDYAVNATTSHLSLATLNSTYSTAVVGFRVFALSISGGAHVYLKSPSGWISFPVNIVS